MVVCVCDGVDVKVLEPVDDPVEVSDADRLEVAVDVADDVSELDMVVVSDDVFVLACVADTVEAAVEL